MVTVLGLIAGVSLLIGLLFWAMGAPWVIPFSLLESILLAVAFYIHAQTFCDFDEIMLEDKHLIVRQERRGRSMEHRFTRGLFRISMTAGPRSLIRIDESGRHVELGKWLMPKERTSLFRELRIKAA
jgi:uncharacterized membrane protein